MTDFIELHVKDFFYGIVRVTIPTCKIHRVREEKHGTCILYSRHDLFGELYSVHCIESYDEVIAQIKKN